MTDRLLTDLAPAMQVLAQKFLDQCAADPLLSGCRVFLTQTHRCEADQNADYAQGRTKPGRIITNAKYGQSPHNCTLPDGTPAALAFDFAIESLDGALDWNAIDAAWQRAISIGTALGLVNGSTFHTLKDCPHFEIAHWANT